MPVSPQDFALWSDLTGNPYPQTPAERMALAPEVHRFTQGIGRRGGYGVSPVRQAVDVIGKAALAAGALAGAAYLGSKGFGKLELDDEPGVPPGSEPPFNPVGHVARTSGDITPPTTSQKYAQNVVPDQTTTVQVARGLSASKPTVVPSEMKPATQSEVIASSQTFSPGTEIEQLKTSVRDRADQLIAEHLAHVAGEQRQKQRIEQGISEYQAGIAGRGERALKEVLKEGRQEGISPIATGAPRAAEAFRQTPQYAEIMRSAGASMEPEELIGAPGQQTSFTKVRPTPETRFIEEAPRKIESPITEMVATKVEPKAVVARPMEVAPVAPTRKSIEEIQRAELAAKAFAHLPRSQREALLSDQQSESIVTRQPESIRVAAGTEDVTQKLLRQAKAIRTSREEAGGILSQDIPNSPVENITVLPSNEVSVRYKTKGGSQTYSFDAHPKYVNELVDRINRGSFIKGQDSAGGFINAGRSMGLLQ